MRRSYCLTLDAGGNIIVQEDFTADADTYALDYGLNAADKYHEQYPHDNIRWEVSRYIGDGRITGKVRDDE